MSFKQQYSSGDPQHPSHLRSQHRLLSVPRCACAHAIGQRVRMCVKLHSSPLHPHYPVSPCYHLASLQPGANLAVRLHSKHSWKISAFIMYLGTPQHPRGLSLQHTYQLQSNI